MNEQVKRHWDKLANEQLKKDFLMRSWGALPQISKNHNFLITGDKNYYWVDYIKDVYFPEGFLGDVLSLGCGEGHIERIFKERGFTFNSITGVDLSEVCIHKALEKGKEINIAQKIDYIANDLNKYSLPRKRFDFIFFFHSLHHVRNLEWLMFECKKALRPKGLIMINEFVGPTRFQWTKQQLEYSNELFSLLPDELRFDLSTHQIKKEIKPMTVEEMILHDESEAVRSGDIERIIKSEFIVVEEKNWGGTINNLLFENTAGNYDQNNIYHKTILDLLVYHENLLIKKNILKSDFKFYMLKNKKLDFVYSFFRKTFWLWLLNKFRLHPYLSRLKSVKKFWLDL